MEVIQLFTSMYYVTGGITNEKWFHRKISVQYIKQLRNAWDFFRDWPSLYGWQTPSAKLSRWKELGLGHFRLELERFVLKPGEGDIPRRDSSVKKKKTTAKHPSEICISIICPNDKFLLGLTSRRNNVFFVFWVSKETKATSIKTTEERKPKQNHTMEKHRSQSPCRLLQQTGLADTSQVLEEFQLASTDSATFKLKYYSVPLSAMVFL